MKNEIKEVNRCGGSIGLCQFLDRFLHRSARMYRKIRTRSTFNYSI